MALFFRKTVPQIAITKGRLNMKTQPVQQPKQETTARAQNAVQMRSIVLRSKELSENVV